MVFTNTAPIFQSLMDSIFHNLDFFSGYFDYIFTASKSAKEQLCHLQIIFERTQVSKCVFVLQDISFCVLFSRARSRGFVAWPTLAEYCQLLR